MRVKIPPALVAALAPHRAALGSSPVVSIELRPAPRDRYWVEVEDDRGRLHTTPAPRALGAAVRFARRFGVDAHALAWAADEFAETATNPFA